MKEDSVNDIQENEELWNFYLSTSVETCKQALIFRYILRAFSVIENNVAGRRGV